MRYLLSVFLIWLGVVAPVHAHKPSDSYLSIDIQQQAIQGQWDIALRDLDYALGLDDNADGQITWGELQRHHDAITAYSLARLAIHADAVPCTSRIIGHWVDKHSDGAYAVLRFAVLCEAMPRSLHIGYRLFFDLDPTHRGLLRLQQQGHAQTAVFSPEQPERTMGLAARSSWRELSEFGKEGVWHIWIGYDHILFLISLLLPAVVVRDGKQWQPVGRFRSAFFEVLKVVTAFTIAHSITLSLAVLGFINLPSRWVESAIAASVLLAALNNIYPLISKRIWLVAFGFGLIHGLGFASVLNDLGLPGSSLMVALVGFNLGVEAGQFAIVSVFLPLAFLSRRSWFYQRLTLNFGSVLIAAIALFWLLDRSLDMGWTVLISAPN
ncbi:MAG: HupE/UreJ family protein [Methylovulum sp.]|nr:HupE/UreJ family protein [Methylovulum sp.]